MIELLNMDCMDYMAKCPDKAFDLAIVDPPYGINASSKNFIRKGKQTGKSMAVSGLKYTEKEWDISIPDNSYFNELIRISKNQIIWGGNYFLLLPSPCWIVWDKENGENLYADCELAWTSFNSAVRKVSIKWHGMLQHDMKNKETRLHPTQKPIKLYNWLLKNYAKEGDRIIDTHLGSGSSAIAALRRGFDFVGIELDPDYFKAAQKRFNEQSAQMPIFPFNND